ncbi:phosphotransferase [Acetobacter lambici]|nr:phosphotransferase [Acetobacter lambici]
MTAEYTHGMGAALTKADWADITATDLEQVLPHFPRAGRLLSIAWRSPRPFSAAARIVTDKGPLFVKRHNHALRTPQNLDEEHRLVRYLKQQGVPVAALLETETGDTIFSHDGWTYEVHNIALGLDLYQDRTSWTPFFNMGHAHAAGAMLARVHRALKQYDAPPRSSSLLICDDRLIRQADPLRALSADLPHRPGLAGFLRERDWERDLQSHLLSPYHASALPFLQTAPRLWTHGDWHASNLLWSSPEQEGTVTSVLDFGLAGKSSALFDLATAIERNLISWLDMETGKTPIADLDQLDALLAGYCSVTPLSATDIRALASILPLTHTDFALSEVDYFFGLLNDRENAILAYDTYLLGHADWFATTEGQRLIHHLHARSNRV